MTREEAVQRMQAIEARLEAGESIETILADAAGVMGEIVEMLLEARMEMGYVIGMLRDQRETITMQMALIRKTTEDFTI